MTRAGHHLRANALVLAWLVAAAVAAVAHRWLPEAGWLLVHLPLLGAVTTAILVWSQHFADTLLRHPAPRGALVARLATHTVGALAVVVGHLASLAPVLVAGGAAVAAAGVAQAVGISRQRRGALPSRFGHLVRAYVEAGLLLVPGVACGVAMAAFAPGPEPYARWYVAHVVLTLVGWVGVTVAGTLVVLWPTILHARIDDVAERSASRALLLLVTGTLIAAAGPATGVRAVTVVGLLVVLAGIALVVRVLVRQARTAPPVTFAAASVGAAVVWWAATVAALGVVVAVAPTWRAAVPHLSALAPATVAGFAAQVLVGALSYLLPVVLGGGPAVSRAVAAELDRSAVVRVVLLNGGLAFFVLPSPSLVRVTASVLALAVGAWFLVLVARAVRIARRGADGAPAAVVPARGSGPDPVAAGLVRARRRGAGSLAVGALLVTVAVALAGDPVAAGLTQVTAGSAGGAGAGGVVATGGTTTVTVEAHDMRFVPDTIDVPAGDRLVLEVVNVDDTVHDLVLDGGATSGRLAPGARVTLDVGVVGGDLAGWCSVAGHRLMGMTLSVVVTGGAALAQDGPQHGPQDEDAAAGGHAGHADTTDGTPAADLLDLMATPDDDFVAHDAVLPPVGDGTTHHVRLEVTEHVQEVAPGVTRTAWTFGGTAPGPVLHGRVGDRFVVTLVNDGSLGHSIDFHAGALAPDDVMRTIEPGETLTYTFTATRSGIWMYHCSTMPMSLHIANGMLGAVVIDPPGLPPVDHEYVLVQSELYLGAQGGPADETALSAQTPTLLTFNGYANQYRDRPLQVAVGERVRVWVLDAGPNRPSSFHVVGGQFDTVYREGDWTLRDGGSTGTGGAQVLALQPAEGGFVELTFPEAGTYPFVTHVMGDAERGASGRFVVSP
ncbi:multicopper oxidase domain-containing protein [Cellulomonas xiejunii]|uniref:Copper-containing nitrite reductase n=1 Tax=Cellulomonas xiejunii TaxID=2968083 RepID=A0ABY5KUX6_9CELL|nr:multicopper oxidase domain-containing protein [Cellulomonas xiejunii]MCC2323034.1 multicopper oxidase domain-containing protein [Cellulomonas xiejunii]UUI73530.1 multicopper oxidase domain-containing protein [Cellulomonas xiejunii]